jgi:hypothetical protein
MFFACQASMVINMDAFKKQNNGTTSSFIYATIGTSENEN